MLLSTMCRIVTYALLVRVAPHADIEPSCTDGGSSRSGGGGGAEQHGAASSGHNPAGCTWSRVWWRCVMCAISAASSAVFGMPTVWWMLSAARDSPSGDPSDPGLCAHWTVNDSAECARNWLRDSTSLGEALLWGWTAQSVLLALGNLVQTCVLPELLPLPAYKRLAQLRMMSDRPANANECLKEDRIRFDRRVRMPFGLRLHSLLRVIMKIRRFHASAYTVLGIVSAAESLSRVFRWGDTMFARVNQVIFYDALVYDTMMVIDDLGSRSQSHAIRELFKHNRHRLYPTMPIAWRLSAAASGCDAGCGCCCGGPTPTDVTSSPGGVPAAERECCARAEEWPSPPSPHAAAAATATTAFVVPPPPLRGDRLSVAGLCTHRLRLSDLFSEVDVSVDGALTTAAQPPPLPMPPEPPGTTTARSVAAAAAAAAMTAAAAGPAAPEVPLTLNIVAGSSGIPVAADDTTGSAMINSDRGGGNLTSPNPIGPLPWPDWMRFQFGYPTYSGLLTRMATATAAAAAATTGAAAAAPPMATIALVNVAAAPSGGAASTGPVADSKST